MSNEEAIANVVNQMTGILEELASAAFAAAIADGSIAGWTWLQEEYECMHDFYDGCLEIMEDRGLPSSSLVSVDAAFAAALESGAGTDEEIVRSTLWPQVRSSAEAALYSMQRLREYTPEHTLAMRYNRHGTNILDPLTVEADKNKPPPRPAFLPIRSLPEGFFDP